MLRECPQHERAVAACFCRYLPGCHPVRGVFLSSPGLESEMSLRSLVLALALFCGQLCLFNRRKGYRERCTHTCSPSLPCTIPFSGNAAPSFSHHGPPPPGSRGKASSLSCLSSRGAHCFSAIRTLEDVGVTSVLLALAFDPLLVLVAECAARSGPVLLCV